MLEIVLDVASDWGGSARDWEALAQRAARAAILETPHGIMLTNPAAFEASVRMTDDAEVQRLNAAYRDKDRPTNVLSFPMLQPGFTEATSLADDGEILLGDIVLARETCVREANEKGVPLDDHVAHLFVHGFLHLLGYDHAVEEGLAEEMEAMETRALATLGVGDPYSDD